MSGYKKRKFSKKSSSSMGRRYGAAGGSRPQKSLASEVKAVVQRMAEKKSITFQTALVTTYSTSNAYSLNSCTMGVFRTNRIASHALWKRLRINFIAATGSVGGAGLVGQPSRLRILIVYDKSTTGGAASGGVTPLISNIVVDPTAANQFYSQYNPSSVPDRFTIIYDCIKPLNVGGGATDQALGAVWKIDKRGSWHTTYADGANAGTAADIQKGGIFLFCLSDQTGTSVPSCAMEMSFDFEDEV